MMTSNWLKFETIWSMFTLEAKRLKIRPETHFLATFGQKPFYTVTLLLSMLETWFWCQTSGFWVWRIIWDHFQEPQTYLKVKSGVEGT